jgi:dihydrodipicolinate synthase/N-acetylneuraminate lyase
MLFEGVHVPLATPFYPDGRLNLRKLEHNVRRYSLTPASGLIALGPNSEIASLSTDERIEVLKTVGAEAAKEKVLTAGIGLPSVYESIQLAEAAAAARFDVVLLAAPIEYAQLLWNDAKATTALLTYFQAIADASPLPVLLHSDADRVALPIELIAQLVSHPNILGVLEQSSHISRITQIREVSAGVKRTATTTITFTAATSRMLAVEQPEVVVAGTFVSATALTGGTAVATAPPVPALKTRTREVGFQVLWAAATDADAALRAGSVALVMPLATSVPQAAFEVWAAWKDGNPNLLAEKQRRLSSAEQGIAAWDTPAIKAGSELSGYFGGRPRLPLLPVTANRAEEIASLLRGMNS